MRLTGNGVFFIAVILLAGIAAYWIHRRHRENRVWRMLMARWGGENERVIGPGELAAIRAQAAFLAGDGGFAVDDITWNDLDMDKLYARINLTYTDAGDHALYAMLRNPLTKPEELGRRSEAMAWAKSDEAGREKVKRLLYNLGRTGSIDLTAMFEREWFSRAKWLGCIALAASLAVSIVLCAVGFAPALLPLLALAAVNVTIYFRSRRMAGNYYSIYRYVPAVLSVAGKIAKLKIPALTDTNERIGENMSRIKGVLGNSFLNNYQSFNNQTVSNPLDILMSFFNVFFLADIISLYNLSRHIFRYRDEIVNVYSQLGEVDSLIAAASWRETLPAWCEPEFEAGAGKRIKAEGLVHPLLRDAVPNDIGIRRNLLLTGSNATGKSTFLKAVAMNAILAQSLYTCAAAHWMGGFFRVYTSMALRDDIFANESYFVTEIKSLKRMMDSFDEGIPCLCIVDEVLRGTNTGERIAAASEALRQFSAGNCLCLAATHDIELTFILEGVFENMHFSETIRDGGISFDYKLKPGRSTSRNAIKLLELLGYGKELVAAANKRLEEFEKTGKWR